jgi:hypothetical protein
MLYLNLAVGYGLFAMRALLVIGDNFMRIPVKMEIKRSTYSRIIAVNYINDYGKNIAELYTQSEHNKRAGRYKNTYVDIFDPNHARLLAVWLNDWADYAEKKAGK